MKKKKNNDLIEKRDQLRLELAGVLANKNFTIKEYDKLNCRLQRLEKKIRKGTK